MQDVYPYDHGEKRSGNEPQLTPINIYDTGEIGDLVLQVPLPGVLPQDVDVEVTPDQVSVRAAKRGGETRVHYYAHEWHSGPYERHAKLPTPVDALRANANFRNGVLTVSLPKASETKPGRVRLPNAQARLPNAQPVQGHAGHRG